MVGLCLIILLAGCASTSDFDATEDVPSRVLNESTKADSPSIRQEQTLPIALIGGYPVDAEALIALALETSGGQILQEMALEQLLVVRMRQAGQTISSSDVQAERGVILHSLSDNADDSIRLLVALQQRRSLGDARFNNLLRRNAMLRALIRNEVEITEASLRLQYRLEYGQRYQLRLILLDSHAEATATLEALRQDETRFAEVAAAISTDISAVRGGLLAPFSVYDESFPAVIREMIPDLYVGEFSPALPVKNQYAIVQMVEVIAPREESFEEVRSSLEFATRLAAERRLMDALARELLNDVDVVIMHPDVGKAWQRDFGE